MWQAEQDSRGWWYVHAGPGVIFPVLFASEQAACDLAAALNLGRQGQR